MKNCQVFEHTADFAIRFKSKTLPDLFRTAARCIFGFAAKRVTRRKTAKKTLIIRQKAETPEELLVNWLNELLSLSAAKGLIFTDFKIKKIGGNALEAVVQGEDVGNFRVDKEFKAATYHGLQIRETPGGWQAEVILDV